MRALERDDLRIPHPEVEIAAMEQDHGSPGTGTLVEEGAAGYPHAPGVRCHGGSSSGALALGHLARHQEKSQNDYVHGVIDSLLLVRELRLAGILRSA